VIGSSGGRDSDPAWAFNLRFGDYEKQTDRVIPVFELIRR